MVLILQIITKSSISGALQGNALLDPSRLGLASLYHPEGASQMAVRTHGMSSTHKEKNNVFMLLQGCNTISQNRRVGRCLKGHQVQPPAPCTTSPTLCTEQTSPVPEATVTRQPPSSLILRLQPSMGENSTGNAEKSHIGLSSILT